jgi:DNA helicase-2/ATP-dependent DNA helicase PcrA
MAEPSRFLEEIDDAYIERPQRSPWRHLSGLSEKKEPPRSFNEKAEPYTVKKDPVQLGKNFKKISGLTQPGNTAPVGNGSDDYEKIEKGMLVEHATFGKGRVMSVEGAGPNKKASVQFDIVGTKQLLLRFAKLKIL